MGQKTNPNIFRLGKTINWNSQYFEKKPTELAVYAFKNLEIKKFIYKFFKDNELILNNCKVYYSDENSLYIYFSYYLTFNSKKKTINSKKKIINSINKKQNIKFVYKKKNSIIRKNVEDYINYRKIDYVKTLKTSSRKKNYSTARRIINFKNKFLKIRRLKFLIKNYKKSLKIRRLYFFKKNPNKYLKMKRLHFFKNFKKSLLVKRLNFLKNYKKYLIVKNNKNAKAIETNNFLSKFFESLHLFINKKINIFLTIQQLNENFDKKKRLKLKSTARNLKWIYDRKENTWFRDGVNTLYNCATKKNSASLLAQFIAFQLKKLKRHNFFLRFIQKILGMFNNKSKFSDIRQRIQIKIKGRFNRRPRARHRIIHIGKEIPNLTINAKIDYAEDTSYTANGTFGIKVWIYEEKKKRNSKFNNKCKN